MPAKAIRRAKEERPLFVLEDFMPFQLAVVANRVSAAVARIIEKEHGLQIPEWRMMVTLANHAPCAAQEVAERTAMDPARVSRAQQRLIDLRLATGTTDPKDRRRVVLELTARGREIVSRMVPEALRIEERLMGSLDASERKALAAIMGKLYRETREIESGGGQ